MSLETTSTIGQLFRQIDTFYRQAMQSWLKVKYAAPATTYVSPDDPEEGDAPTGGGNPLEALEAIWDQIDNPMLADQLDKLMSAYRGFTDALKIVPEDYAKSPEQFVSDNEETVGDFINTLNNRWEKLITNPYLNADNPKYSESFSPDQIIQAAENLVNDAKRQLEGTGTSVEEVAQAQQAAQEFNQLQFDKGDQKLNITGDKVKQMLEAGKRYRQKLRSIRMIGVDNLNRRRGELKQQADQTTNQIEKEDLLRQLARLPDPASYEKMKANQRKVYQSIMTDPSKKREYLDRAKTRQQQRRLRDRKMVEQGRNADMDELIAQYNTLADPAAKARIAKDIVSVERVIMENQGIDLDDPYVFNDPANQKRLDPLNIIKKYQDRFSRIKKERAGEIGKSQELRQKGRAGGDIDGLTEIFRDQLATVVNELKKKIDKKITKDGMNDPVFKPFLDALAQAPNEAARQAGLLALQAAVKDYKNNHPLVQALIQKLKPLEEVKKELMDLTSHNRLKNDKGKKNPWFYGPAMPEDKKVPLIKLVNDLDTQAGQFGQVAGADLDTTIRNISAVLKQRIVGAQMTRQTKLQRMLKQAQERALLAKIAEEAPDTNDASEQENWAHKALKQMLEMTEIDLPVE